LKCIRIEGGWRRARGGLKKEEMNHHSHHRGLLLHIYRERDIYIDIAGCLLLSF